MVPIKRLFFCLLFCLSPGAFVFAQKAPVTKLKRIAPERLRGDLVLLKKILEANHPSLYWYTPKDSVDLYFSNAVNSITDSMDEVQFKNKVSEVISIIRCGHTSVRFSRAYAKKAAKFRYPLFPLSIKTWKDSMVVLGSLFPGDSVFKRGTIITGINGRSNQALTDTLFRFISTDGYANNHKSQVLSGNFGAWYKTVLGLDSVYRISYIDNSGKESVALIRNFEPVVVKDSANKKQADSTPAFKKPTRKEIRKARLLAKRSFVIDTSTHTAFMSLSTFSGGWMRAFFRRSFKTMENAHIQNLVLELRTNGGGRVNNSILLTSYLSDHPFKVGDSVVAVSRKFKYGRYIHPSWVYWFAMNFGAHKMEDGKIHYRYYEKKVFEPKTEHHFSGNIFLLQGGYSFSATTMFIAALKGQQNVTTVGEETGGGYYGNSAMHIPTIRLPNSGLQITLPMYRLVMDASRPKGHGIMPDVLVDPSSQAIRQAIDPKIIKTMELIQQKSALRAPVGNRH